MTSVVGSVVQRGQALMLTQVGYLFVQMQDVGAVLSRGDSPYLDLLVQSWGAEGSPEALTGLAMGWG
jgi:hypothetical protein